MLTLQVVEIAPSILIYCYKECGTSGVFLLSPWQRFLNSLERPGQNAPSCLLITRFNDPEGEYHVR